MSQRPCPSDQPGQMRTKGGVQPFNVSGINNTLRLLRKLAQPFYLMLITLNNAPLNFQTRGQASFDNLHQRDVVPDNQLGPTFLVFADFLVCTMNLFLPFLMFKSATGTVEPLRVGRVWYNRVR